MTQANVQLRVAVREDVTALRKLIDKSVRGLQTLDYSQAQIEGALKTVFGVDSQIIADGTYIVAEAESSAIEPSDPKEAKSRLMIVGCGGRRQRHAARVNDQWGGCGVTSLAPHHRYGRAIP